MFKENNIIRKSKLDQKLINQTYEEKPFIYIILLHSNNLPVEDVYWTLSATNYQLLLIMKHRFSSWYVLKMN